jgi:hypothetical protein
MQRSLAFPSILNRRLTRRCAASPAASGAGAALPQAASSLRNHPAAVVRCGRSLSCQAFEHVSRKPTLGAYLDHSARDSPQPTRPHTYVTGSSIAPRGSGMIRRHRPRTSRTRPTSCESTRPAPDARPSPMPGREREGVRIGAGGQREGGRRQDAISSMPGIRSSRDTRSTKRKRHLTGVRIPGRGRP